MLAQDSMVILVKQCHHIIYLVKYNSGHLRRKLALQEMWAAIYGIKKRTGAILNRKPGRRRLQFNFVLVRSVGMGTVHRLLP